MESILTSNLVYSAVLVSRFLLSAFLLFLKAKKIIEGDEFNTTAITTTKAISNTVTVNDAYSTLTANTTDGIITGKITNKGTLNISSRNYMKIKLYKITFNDKTIKSSDYKEIYAGQKIIIELITSIYSETQNLE